LVLSIPIRVDAVDTNFELREGDDPTTSLAAFIDLHDLGDDHSHQLWDTVRKATLLQGRTPMVRRVVVNCRAGRLMNCLMKAMCYVDKETKYDIAFIAEIDAYKAVCSARKTVKGGWVGWTGVCAYDRMGMSTPCLILDRQLSF